MRKSILTLCSSLILGAAPLAASPISHNMLHGDIAIGGMMVSGNDLNKNYSSPSYKPNFGDAFSFMVSGQGGFLTTSGFYIDLGFDVGPLRTITSSNSTTILGIPYKQDEKLEFTQYRAMLIPGFMLPMGKLILSGQLGVGYSLLHGDYTNKTTWVTTTESGYSINGSTIDYVPELRIQYLLNPKTSAGLAVGWNGSKFNELNGCCGTNGYSGAIFKNPLKTNSDPNANKTIDHTGVFAKLVISTYVGGLGSGAKAQDAATQPAEAAPAAQGGTPLPGAAHTKEGWTLAGQVQAEIDWGHKDYAAKRFKEAADHYGMAASLDPQNAKAYQFLGNAQLYGGKRADAIAAYERSLALNPNNPALRTYVDRLKAK